MQSNLFKLPTSDKDLALSNQGMSNMKFEQNAPTRNVVGANFSNGAIHFKFSTYSGKWWLPSSSYFRMRFKLAKTIDGAGAITAKLRAEDDIAPTMGFMPSLFQSMEARINDTTVSRVPDYVAQVDALAHRLHKNRSWLNGIGHSSNFWKASFLDRQQDITTDSKRSEVHVVTSRAELGIDAGATIEIAVDSGVLTVANNFADLTTLFKTGDEIEIVVAGTTGTLRHYISHVINATTMQLNKQKSVVLAAGAYDFNRIRKQNLDLSRNVNEFEVTWKPECLGLLNIQHGLPTGNYELVLNPHTSSVYKINAVESLLGSGNKTAGTDFNLNIVDMYYYIHTVEGPRVDNKNFYLDLEQLRCQTQNIENTSLSQKNFEVSPSTFAVAIAYQDSRVNTDTQCSPSRFLSYDANITTEEQNKLNRLYIQYSGTQLPQPDADPSYDAGSNKDNTVQRYVETQLYNGGYYDDPETLTDWRTRGPYYYFRFPKDGSDGSTRLNVNQSFDTADVANMQLLVFDQFKQVASVQVAQGVVRSVTVNNE